MLKIEHELSTYASDKNNLHSRDKEGDTCSQKKRKKKRHTHAKFALLVPLLLLPLSQWAAIANVRIRSNRSYVLFSILLSFIRFKRILKPPTLQPIDPFFGRANVTFLLLSLGGPLMLPPISK